jgi:hypothetical protein
MSNTQEPEIKSKFKQLYVDYKSAVIADYFTNIPKGVVQGSIENPVLTRLATPKLPQDLAQHLEKKN